MIEGVFNFFVDVLMVSTILLIFFLFAAKWIKDNKKEMTESTRQLFSYGLSVCMTFTVTSAITSLVASYIILIVMML